MRLLIGNKNYSSWSLRPWLVMAHFDLPFDEEVLLLNGEGWKERLIERSPTGRVPVLIDGDLAVSESIAIIEYLADKFPDKAIWPIDMAERALARSVSAEMHAGFSDLRRIAPMNMRASLPGRLPLDALAGDLHRLETLWGDCLERSGGPFLFGAFSAADAMYAPVTSRIRTYQLPVSDMASGYVEAIHALPAFQTWLADAVKEPWIVEEDEIDISNGAT